MNVVDLFSGVGGFSSGFINAGFDVIMANEIDVMIADSYKKNHKNTLMINKDIKEFTNNIEDIINSELEKLKDENRSQDIRNKLKSVDVIIGGPPCQGFSMAGSRIRKKNEFIDDPRNFLFKYYFKIIQKFEPKYFIMENVPGLQTMKGGAILDEILSIFSDEKNFKKGKYNLSKKIVSADELGVPQSRKRLIIIGSKYDKVDIDKEIEKIKVKLDIPEKVTVEEAISDLDYLESGEGQFESDYINIAVSQYQKERRKNSCKLYNHIAPKHKEIALERIRKIKRGQNWTNLEDSEKIKSVHSGAYGRLELNKTASTITTRFDTPSAGRVIHPNRDRALTPREAARLQSFDDDFIFYGNKMSIGKQIGNAVPPKVAYVLAKIILEDYKKRV